MSANKNLPKVAVVILCWNGKKFLEKFLPSVVKTTYQNLEIVVADNNSIDGSAKYVKESYPEISVIEIEKNDGFATGYNKALKQVKADYYVLLNQDVEVEPDWIEPVIDLMESDKAIAACQPKIRWCDDREYFEYAGAAGGFIDKFGYTFCRGRIFEVLEKDTGQYDEVSEIFWASGAAMFVKADLFHKFGGFDDDFFAHMEEIDLCWRMKNAGYKIMYCPDSVVYHVGGGSLPKSNPKKTFLNFRNNLIMMIKNLPDKQVRWKIKQRLVLDHIAAYKALFGGKTGDYGAIAKAHREVLYFYKKWRKKREEVKKVVEANSIGEKNKKGTYKGSIINEYFFRKRRMFNALSEDNFN